MQSLNRNTKDPYFMPFDKKLACLTNFQERRSFPWPLVVTINHFVIIVLCIAIILWPGR